MAYNDNNDEFVVVQWNDVKKRYIGCVENGDVHPQDNMHEHYVELHRNPYQKNDWEGASGAQTLDWLRNGYRAPEFEHSAERVAITDKNRHVWNEDEGDIDIARLYSGRDEFMLGAAKRPSKPGLRVQIEYAFSWMVNQKTIEKYAAWTLGLLGSLEASGFDLVVDVWFPLDNLRRGHRGRTNTLLRVKQPNELSNFTEWSALFGPSGFRQLGFGALAEACEQVGDQVSGGFGHTLGGETWNVTYDIEDANLIINCDQRANNFPEDKMIRAAADTKIIPGFLNQPDHD